jgi:hypothetical protein
MGLFDVLCSNVVPNQVHYTMRQQLIWNKTLNSTKSYGGSFKNSNQKTSMSNYREALYNFGYMSIIAI